MLLQLHPQKENDNKKYSLHHSLHYPSTQAENSICFTAREMESLREKYDCTGGKKVEIHGDRFSMGVQ